VIVLTKKDIDMIPARRWFIDIYLLLLEHGHIQIDDHGGLYVKALQYLSDFWYLGNNVLMLPFSPLATKIQEILITSSAETLLFFYKMLPTIIKTATFQGDILLQRMISVSAYLSNLEQSNAAKELSWIPFRSELLEEYKEKLGESHLLTNFLREVYLPCFLQLYTTEKQIQKATMDTCKEELIAYCWHPDRFQTWCLDEEEKAENRELFG
jgi:hypothetical protein